MKTELGVTRIKDALKDVSKCGGLIKKLDFIEKEVDMGFFQQHSFEVKDGVVVNFSCQRIKKCGCNCNDCMLFN